MTLRDYETACQEARTLLAHHPSSEPLWEAYIQALAKSGEEKRMVQAWDRYVGKFPQQASNRRLLEVMAWGVIEKGAVSSSPVIRLCSMLAAALGEDAKGVDILRQHVEDPNAIIRAATLELVSHFRDFSLQEAVLERFKKEKHFQVRLEVIKAMGKMNITEAQAPLARLVASGKASAEEKAAAIESLVYLLENPKKGEVDQLAKSARAGLRELACEVVAHSGETDHLDMVIPLLRDHSAQVRCAALQVLGLLQIKEWKKQKIEDLISKLIDDPHHHVAITAAWVLTLHDPNQGQAAMRKWLHHRDREVRLLASGALASLGKYADPLIQEVFDKTEDSYQKMNLALGLIGQGVKCQEACRSLYCCFVEEKDRWMWERQGLFRFITPCYGRQQDFLAHHPEVMNQLTRLDILNVLAILGDSHAQPAIKHFLKERDWRVSGLAVALLLTEGDETALALVEGLLDDLEEKTRVQAAGILALWGRGERAIQILQDAYTDADRELKERILEGIGHIGARSSIPFLTEQLKESYQSLRIIAAASLLKCLYH
ncbi:MAG: HEAT repeat domain-containing protein [Waddliaceae bacterium]